MLAKILAIGSCSLFIVGLVACEDPARRRERTATQDATQTQPQTNLNTDTTGSTGSTGGVDTSGSTATTDPSGAGSTGSSGSMDNPDPAGTAGEADSGTLDKGDSGSAASAMDPAADKLGVVSPQAIDHLRSSVKFPATKAEIKSHLDTMEKVSDQDKKLIDKLPVGTYNSVEEVLNALHSAQNPQ